MQVLLRGHTEFTEVPDNPVPPSPATTTLLRGEAAADTHASFDHAASAASIMRADPVIPTSNVTMPDAAPAIFSAFTHTDAPIQWFAQGDAPAQGFAHGPAPFVPVPSAIADVPALTVGRGEGLSSGGTGGSGNGDIARGSDDLPQLAMSAFDYSDHGWSIVPSAANEYGASYAVADSFAWDAVTGEFANDFFIV